MYARQAIQTRFIPPTNTRPSRVKAFCEAKAITRSWDHSLNVCENHYAIAMELAKIMNWPTDGHGFGSLPNDGYAMTFPVTP
jgi:hypothetical protein